MSNTVREVAHTFEETEDNQRKYVKIYEVNTGSTLYDENGIMQITEIPARWAAHPSDGYARVTRRRGRLSIDPYNWTIEIEYNTLKGTRTATDNPLLEWPKIAMRFQDYQMVVERDQAGNLVQASSKEPFDPPVEETYSYVQIDITRNVATFNLLTARDYKNSVNSADVTLLGVTLSKGDGYLADDSATPMAKDGVNYFEEHLSILISDKGLPAGIDTWMRWQQVLLDQGLYIYDSATDRQIRIRDSENVEVVKPRRLDGSGQELMFTDTPVWLPFSTKKTRAWSGLSLPATWHKP